MKKTVEGIIRKGAEFHKGETLKIQLSSGEGCTVELGRVYYVVEAVEKETRPRKAVINGINVQPLMFERDKPRFYVTIDFVAVEGNGDPDHPDHFNSEHIVWYGPTEEGCIEALKDLRKDLEADGAFDKQ